MNVSELFNLTRWIDREIVDKQVQQKYQALFNVLQQNIQPHQHQQPFENHKNAVIDSIRAISLSQLTEHQLDFLDKLGIAGAIGEKGVEQLEGILYKNSLDLATSASKTQQIFQKINEGINKSNQIKAGLNGCVSEEEYEYSDEVLMRVTFTGNASMSNVTDFKDWGGIWYNIGRGIAIAHDLSPEDIKIIGATRGSVILEMSMIPVIAGTVGEIILYGLEVAKRVMDIKVTAQTLRGLQLQNDKLATDLETEAENEKQAGIERIAGDVAAQLTPNSKQKAEKIKLLETSVKSLVNFIERGGVVDLIAPNDDEEPEEGHEGKYEKLRVTFEEIRRLEHNMELLEYDALKDA